MSKQLYEEALADVKKLKEVAEDNAKRALLEAVTPRIRDLIENQLLGESYAEEIEADKDKLLMDEPASQVEVPTPVEPSPRVGDADASASAISLPDEEGKVTLDLAALKVPGDDEYELSMESAAALGLLVKSGGVPTEDPRRRIESLGEKVNLFTSAGRLVSESEGYLTALAEIISEVEDVYGFIQNDLKESEDKNAYEAVLEGHYATLKQLMEQKMNKGKKELAEADVTLKLTGMPDDIDLDSIGVDLVSDDEAPAAAEDAAEEEDEEAEETEEEAADEDLDLEEEGDDKKMESTSLSDDTIVEIDEGMLRREIARMKSLREADETAPQSWGNGPGDVSDEFEDEDLGDPFVDVELTTEGEDDDKKESDDKKMDEYGMDEDDDKKAEEAQDKKVDELEELDMDQAEDDRERGGNVAPDSMGPGAKTNKQLRHTESLKNRLEAEVHIQTEAKKKAQAAKKKQLEAQKKMKQAKKVQEKEQAKKQAKKMQEAYAFYATKFNESVARSNKLKGMLNEATRKDGAALNGGTKRSDAETDNLRTKLAETNLFNAKLLFTNKLLQLESLTKRQKAEVIERLDEAKSEREVKLVYESLVKALQGAPAKLAESTDRGVIGSSSRPARQSSASNSLNEGVEADRWARLAGIVK